MKYIQIQCEVYIHKLFIFTDSDYSLKSFTKWAKDWEKNGWKKSDGGNIKNIELIKTGFTLYKKYCILT